MLQLLISLRRDRCVDLTTEGDKEETQALVSYMDVSKEAVRAAFLHNYHHSRKFLGWFYSAWHR